MYDFLKYYRLSILYIVFVFLKSPCVCVCVGFLIYFEVYQNCNDSWLSMINWNICYALFTLHLDLHETIHFYSMINNNTTDYL